MSRDHTGPRFCIEMDRVSKDFGAGAGLVRALREVSIAIPTGSFTAVIGPSGSGKSTFLHCAAGLDRPTKGTIRLAGRDITRLREPKLTGLRREQVGFVFQAFNLVGSLTVAQNIALPLKLSGRRADRSWQREVIERVGLTDRLRHRPAQLSGGQQQRVAIARALVTRPAVLFADEPTGALDAAASTEVLGLLRAVVDKVGQSVVMVTHDAVAASYADAVLVLSDGRLVERLVKPTMAQIAEQMTAPRSARVR